jgi:hypothetical protein
MDVNLSFTLREDHRIEGIWEQSAEKNICTKVEGIDSRLEKIT